MYIFNMVVLSVNPTPEKNFFLIATEKNFRRKIEQRVTIRYYYNNKELKVRQFE